MWTYVFMSRTNVYGSLFTLPATLFNEFKKSYQPEIRFRTQNYFPLPSSWQHVLCFFKRISCFSCKILTEYHGRLSLESERIKYAHKNTVTHFSQQSWSMSKLKHKSFHLSATNTPTNNGAQLISLMSCHNTPFSYRPPPPSPRTNTRASTTT